MAALAEQMADAADAFASVLERAADRGDRARRLALAEVERKSARVERRNAARLRDTFGGVLRLEHLPALPTFEHPTAHRQRVVL
jgi:hypothetical protein